ncbi:hypothetical protein DUNSADRAFT_170 [Dunaliella salina]|uniref:DNA polymerase kappa n=1 Tax=Dunaliella salina TaxID=3046 RepID=A0ABQ7FZF4_DUNSA|nr:hypothetical protein DUNSADRAFT_170 [Dunaliella salina]|eukprot:KAF5827726.1 hypothetical protein DUNSADRAFT_170 [Dunaliella salina]
MSSSSQPADYHTVYTNAKAGMEGVDKAHVQKIVYEMSKGSKHFMNEQRKNAETEARIARLKQQYAQLTDAEVVHHTKAMDAQIAVLEASRDTSRVWIHVDMDAFYAGCEELANPALRDVPMAVGGIGMISTANYHARRFGVRSAMPGFIGRRLCPQLVFVKPNFERYQAASEVTRAVFRRYDPHFEAGSLDEAFLDVTHFCRRTGVSGAQVAARVRHEVQSEAGVTCSCGIAVNKMLAKICSDINKPNGQFCLVDAAAGGIPGVGGQDLCEAHLPVRTPPASVAATPRKPPFQNPVTASAAASPKAPPPSVVGGPALVGPARTHAAAVSPSQAAAPVLSPAEAPTAAAAVAAGPSSQAAAPVLLPTKAPTAAAAAAAAAVAAAPSSQAADPPKSPPAMAAALGGKQLHQTVSTPPSMSYQDTDAIETLAASTAGAAAPALTPAPGTPTHKLFPGPTFLNASAARQPAAMNAAPGAEERLQREHSAAVPNDCVSEVASDNACIEWYDACEVDEQQGGSDGGVIEGGGDGSGTGKLMCSSRRAVIMAFVDTLPVRKIPGIGRVTESLLFGVLGVKTCGELLAARGSVAALFSQIQTRFFLEAGESC